MPRLAGWVVGGSILAAYFAVPAGWPKHAIYLAVELAVAGVLWWAGSTRWPGPSWPWRLLSICLLLWMVSFIGYASLAAGSPDSAPPVVPAHLTWPDIVRLGVYPLVALALLGIGQHRAGRHDPDGLLDASIFTVAVAVTVSALFGWRGAMSGPAEYLPVVFALADVLLMGMVLRLAMLPGRRPTSLKLLIASISVVLLGDLGYLLGAVANLRWDPLIAGLHLLALLTIAAAVLTPSFSEFGTPVPAPTSPTRLQVRRLRLSRALLLGGAWLLPPAIFIAQALAGRPPQTWGIAAAWLAIFALVALRLQRLTADIAEAEVQQVEGARFQAAFENALVGVAMVVAKGPAAGKVLRVNHRLARMLGRGTGDLEGENIVQIVDRRCHPQIAGELAGAYRRAEEEGTATLPGEYRLAASGEAAWAVLGVSAAGHATLPHVRDDLPLAIVQVEDVTERREAQRQLQHQAAHDPLTGLANRMLLSDRLEHALARRSPPGQLAVLMLDLDRFKQVNDTLGHAGGDELLSAIAARIAGAVRPEDTVARLGGDEFVVLLDGLDGMAEAELVAQRVGAAISQPIQIAGQSVTAAASIGIAVAAPGDRVESLLRNADLAMYQAKAQGRDRAERYDEGLRALADSRLSTERWLREAVGREQGLRLALQPMINLASGTACGFEALARCQHPERGVLTADAFIAVAEESGLIFKIGSWVLRSALDRMALEIGAGGMPDGARVSVNISGRQLVAPRFAEEVTELLAVTGVSGDRLTLEITEHALVETLDVASRPLRDLRDQGVQIALDDFGTGYSSLTHLRALPVDVLKIDRSFIAGMLDQAADASIVEAMINLAHALGLRTVGEGIETDGQAQALTGFGCDLGQGFHLGRPELVDLTQIEISQPAGMPGAASTVATATATRTYQAGNGQYRF